MSQVSRIAQNVFVFVIVFVFFLVMSCLLITLNKCFKGHKSLRLLLGGVLKMSLSLSLYLSLSIFLVMSCLHSEQMSQRSQVSRIVFVFAIGECVSAESLWPGQQKYDTCWVF